jgi:hypothetical protein
MAVALDLDELDQYWQFLLAGGKDKDWKWSSPDRAGTRQLLSEGSTEQQRVVDIFETAARMLTRNQAGLRDMPKGGRMVEFFERSGRQQIQRIEYPDGKVEYRDTDGELVDMPKDAAFFVAEKAEDA